MSEMDIHIDAVDKVGFPMIRVHRIGQFHLWPVSKLQFERFICETRGYGDGWYDEVLGLLPRVSLRRMCEDNYEGAFIAGVLPQEALAFAKWLGDGFDLPTVEEWRHLHLRLREAKRLKLLDAGLSPEAMTIWKNLTSFRSRPLEVGLVESGLVEWVRRKDRSYAGLGSPRSCFYHHVWNPMTDEVSTIHKERRVRYFGFRLISRR